MIKQAEIDITITAIADDAFPVWVNFELIDRHEVKYVFEEKLPIILSYGEFLPDSLPMKSTLTVEIIAQNGNYSVVNTMEPYGISSLQDLPEFEIATANVHPMNKQNTHD